MSVSRSGPLEVVDRDLQIQPAARKTKSGGLELRGPEMTFCIIRCPDPFTRDSHKIRIQFAVGILVVKDRYRISPRSNAWEFTGSLPMRDLGLGACNCFLSFPGKAIRRRKERAHNLALVVV